MAVFSLCSNYLKLPFPFSGHTVVEFVLCTSAHASRDLGLLHMTHFWLKEQVIRLPHFHFFSFFTLVRSLAGYSLRPHLLPLLWIDVALCVSLCVCAFFVLHVESLSSSSYYGSSCVWCSWFLKILPKHLKTQSSRNVISPSNYALWNVTWMHLNGYLWRHPHPQLFQNTFIFVLLLSCSLCLSLREAYHRTTVRRVLRMNFHCTVQWE